MGATLSCIITAKDRNDPKLKDLLYSIEQQTFRNFETIIITEGNSETAKAIGLKRAKGKFICILASDNYLNDIHFFEKCLRPLQEDNEIIGSFPVKYYYTPMDNILNRYFALMGVNDPVPLYLHKNDRKPYYSKELLGYPVDLLFSCGDRDYIRVKFQDYIPTLGDNGFFVRKEILEKANIENYFHIDVCEDLRKQGYNHYAVVNTSIWHKTCDNLIKFFYKRFIYADKFSKGRRWKMVEEADIPRLIWFIICTLTLMQPLYISIKGYRKIKDIAWFLHLPICLITIGVYGIWILKKLIKSLVKFPESILNN